MIKAVIFDLDGTTLDSVKAIRHFVNTTLHKHRIAGITEEECKIYVGNGAKTLIQNVLSSKGLTDPILFQNVLTDYNRAYDSNPFFLTKPFDGILTVMEDMKKRDIRIAIVSNKPESVVIPLVKHFFGNLIDIVHGATEQYPLKPDPTMCLEILQKFHVSPKDTIYVGDTNTDMKTGKNLNAGLVVGVLWGFRCREELEEAGADVVLETPSQLMGLLS